MVFNRDLNKLKLQIWQFYGIRVGWLHSCLLLWNQSCTHSFIVSLVLRLIQVASCRVQSCHLLHKAVKHRCEVRWAPLSSVLQWCSGLCFHIKTKQSWFSGNSVSAIESWGKAGWFSLNPVKKTWCSLPRKTLCSGWWLWLHLLLKAPANGVPRLWTVLNSY